MPDIIVAADESAATTLVHFAEANLPPITRSGTGNLGPFNTSWGASAYLANGRVDLRPPNVIRIVNCEVHFKLNFSISINLNNISPPFCLPQVCFTIKIFKKKITICTPKICIPWPTITIPIGHSDVAKFTSDFTLHTYPSGSDWHVDAEIVGIPNLQFGAGSAALLAAIGVAAGAVLVGVPFIGPFLAMTVVAITAAIGIAGITGFLGPILGLLVNGTTFRLFDQPKHFAVLPMESAIDPAVMIYLERVTASVVGSNEDELVFAFEIA